MNIGGKNIPSFQTLLPEEFGEKPQLPIGIEVRARPGMPVCDNCPGMSKCGRVISGLCVTSIAQLIKKHGVVHYRIT